MFLNTYGVLINDKVVGKVTAFTMAEAASLAAARWSSDELRVHLWGRA